MEKAALIIGAGGGLGSQLVETLLADTDFQRIHAVSRRALDPEDSRLVSHCLPEHNNKGIEQLCRAMADEKARFRLVVCCIGQLHAGGKQPEKRLEDLDEAWLVEGFRVNSIIPALWIKHLPLLLSKEEPAVAVFISARVGSIGDNRLGGWYAYRAAKAALNMLVATAQVEYRRRRPEVRLVCYHPGTVDTSLSRPFQANVPAEQLFSAKLAVQHMLSVLEGLPQEQGPYYLDWRGNRIPW
ncbi:SDR family NAD(P)-dependent oxidoreductase [Bowmanella dokdonensis]|uniref:SDR family NAD(P)-dependent oxidoreductase n=1 Tax=Bowmanella dokdonensis TaxID=751969 RepID=A0A939DNK4_9ALTE|nr:SDR family NAD(P)-dependent oxidoreductase [Bowmanella dokdonensis]MBN7825937.1 SDR family NAD(P)-dependent oxidoreductase [Bowmanella dokdonensis]